MKLDQLRKFYKELPNYLSNVAKEISFQFDPSRIQTFNVVYFPQLGFLVTIPIEDEASLESLSQTEGLELQFATEKFAYFKEHKTKGTNLYNPLFLSSCGT